MQARPTIEVGLQVSQLQPPPWQVMFSLANSDVLSSRLANLGLPCHADVGTLKQFAC